MEAVDLGQEADPRAEREWSSCRGIIRSSKTAEESSRLYEIRGDSRGANQLDHASN